MSLVAAERALFDHYGIAYASRRVRLADPALEVRVVEAGDGEPLVLVHGSGMSAPTWAPLMAHLRDRRVIAVDLPGFGASDGYEYRRPLRAEAVAQMTSLLDALGLERAHLAGTSLGGMWVLNVALARPQRVATAGSIGMPAVALPGVRADPFFRAMTTPGVRRLVKRLPPPKNQRRLMAGVIGQAAVERMPQEWFDVVAAGQRGASWMPAMYTHLNLGLRSGRGRPENQFSDEELRRIRTPVLMIWGDRDRYGGPEIGRRAVALMPDARLEVIPGNHAPFLDDPRRCAQLLDSHGS